jgi:hypothetical protein
MRAIVQRWRDEVHRAGHSRSAMRHFVLRRHATDDAEKKVMAAEFLAILAEVPAETAERLRLLDEFAAVLHDASMMLHDWNRALDEVEAGGIAGGDGDDDEDGW